ncbi:ankyrin [Glonium stellatum]|uniref:Ankyrin n=1 Tax=Glonium stellatum TaxID=574774 RepID=A0A8E2JW59_9PEZI|nr:ankyrin [Glonium stellatum]
MKVDVARIVLQNGADVNSLPNTAVWPFSQPPLRLAAMIIHDVDITNFLPAASAQVNAYAKDLTAFSMFGLTALSMAVFHDNVEAVRLLLEVGADVDGHNDEIMTMLDLAFLTGKKDIYKLLEHSSPRSRTSLTLSGILHAAGKGAPALTFGVDPNAGAGPADEGPALLIAVKRYSIEVVGLLLGAGADIDAPDVLRRVARHEENFKILDFLIERGDQGSQ